MSIELDRNKDMKIILHIIKKEFLQFMRDPKMVAINIIAPAIQLLVFTYAATLDVREVSMIVCDHDNSYYSRQLLSGFTNSGYFRTVESTTRSADIDIALIETRASVGIVIPAGFGNDLLAGKQPQIQALADGSDANSSGIGLAYASQIINRYIGLQLAGSSGPRKTARLSVNPEIRIWYNPELSSRNFMVPGVLGLLLMIMTMMLTSLAIVKERENGTMDQLLVTPIKSYQLIIGKLTPFFCIGVIDILLVMLVATQWFGVPVRGSHPLLFSLCLLFIMTTLGLGLFISTVSSNQQQAMMTAIFFVMMPMIYLSGFVFPIENMPRVIQALTYLLPLRYFYTIIRGIFLRGSGLAELWPHALALLIFGVGILSLSVTRFRRKLE